ncbi:MAG: type II secretion system F family protein [Acidaminococcaceae bacterium]|nr:type II secretion system F family protein [Acidaminococcaceae bacterium]
MIIFVSILTAVLLFFLILLMLEYRKRTKRALSRRMHYYAGDMDALEGKKDDRTLGEKFMDWLRETGQQMQKARQGKTLDLRMRKAGLSLLGTEFLIILALSAALGFVVAFILSKKLYLAVLVAVFVMMMEWVYVLVRTQRREALFRNQLGDCLTMVANAMRAGFSFLQAMDLIAKEMEPPISEEFKHVMRDISLGTSMERALEDMDKRVGSPDFSLVVTAVLIQQQVGGDLARILDTISETIQDRIRMRREVQTLTAQGRISGWVLAALPVAMCILLNVISPGYLDPLFKERIGQMAIGGAIVLIIIGFIIIQRIVDIEV